MNKFMIRASAALLMLAATCWFGQASAMPSYARQTGLDCNSCHIGFDPVPNFTRTGRLFIMRGFHQPNSIQGKFRQTGFNGEGKDTPEYGGNYLALPWTDFFSARLVSDILTGGASPTGVKNDTTSNPGSRMALFITGPITDWLGLWTEWGYLGNNSLHSVSSNNPGEATNLNLTAYDEYRLTASKMIGSDSFIAMAFGNEYPDAINEFNFPVFQIRPWGFGQGGVGKEYSIGSYSFLGFWNNSILTQYSIMTGDYDTSWSNGHNNYIALSYNGIPGTGDKYRRESNDLWWNFETVWGNNLGSQVNPMRTSLICTTTCPAGVSDAGGLSYSNTVGYQWETLSDLKQFNGTGTEVVDTGHAYRLEVIWDAADFGNHSWVGSAAVAENSQDYVSGAKSDQRSIGLTFRYLYNRTYGGIIYVNKPIHYSYTDVLGVEHSAYTHIQWGISALWQPAMNVNFRLSYSPIHPAVLDSANYHGDGYSWSLELQYGI